jgi:hypothetical protein
MARIDIKSAGATLNDGVLQLENGVAMDTTLRNVADQNNTTSPLLLSTTAVQVESPLRITTDDPSDMYLDCEDGATNNRFNITRNTASQQVNLNFASNPAGSTTTVGAIRTFTNGVNLGEVVKFREDGQVTFTERVNVEADSLVTTQSSSVIAATTTDANLVIAPNGTGALIASIPDGTATGGNARGTDAVDLQMIRGNANQVASGNYSVIAGGSTNRNNGGTYGFIGGGLSNIVSSDYSTVSGGQSNTASTATHATVIGGQGNTSSGQHSMSGGLTSTASGGRSVAFGSSTASGQFAYAVGDVVTASGSKSVALGADSQATQLGAVAIGNVVSATAESSFASGNRSSAYLLGQNARANGFFVGSGDAQNSNLTARRAATLTTAGTTTLSLDGTGTTSLIIPSGNDRMWNVQVRWVAVVAAITGTATGVTVGDTKVSTDLLAVAKRVGATTVGAHTSAGTSVIETTAGSLTTVNITYSAGASQEMAITFTGPTFLGGGSVTMRVVAAISLTEVAY